MKVAIILLALVTASGVATPPRAGVMVSSAGCGVLAMDGPALDPGTKITLVTIDDPQKVSFAVIKDQITGSEIMAKHIVQAPYYEVTPSPASGVLPSLAIAIVDRLEVEQQGSIAILRAGKNSDTIRVRSCASSEGLHFTLWAGEPLKSTRLWHMYYYLGYDVEPDCQPADYQEGK